MEFVRAIFQSLFKDTTITTNFLESYICNTSCVEINTFSTIFNCEEMRNFKVRSTHSVLKASKYFNAVLTLKPPTMEFTTLNNVKSTLTISVGINRVIWDN